MRINYIHLDRVDSTNDWAKRECSSWETPTCVTAEEQIAGRGRLGRIWKSPWGQNIYATLFIKFPLNFSCLINIGQIMVLSCVEFLRENRILAQIKWPNDIVVSDKKLGGVLVETSCENSSHRAFIGLGLNVNMGKEDLLTIDQAATSLLDLTLERWEKQIVLDSILFQFLENFHILQKNSFVFFKHRVENLLAYKGEQVTCYHDGVVMHGICYGLTDAGYLRVYTNDQRWITIVDGDVSLKRAL
jgi:BirA family transcriptional regulator, biotin operon repressor / biotin---[acetyl-CoA-carboxylase] ligase